MILSLTGANYPGKGFTRNTVVFGLCFLLAVILLLLNKLSKNYESQLEANINYVNYPAHKVPVKPLPAALKLNVETTGFKLVWAKIGKPIEVKMDLSKIPFAHYALTNDMKISIASQLSNGFKLNEIYPDTLYFDFDNSRSKKVPVVPDILISFKKQFDFTEQMVIKPDSVLITGPENVVDNIESWKTAFIEFSELDKSEEGEVALMSAEIPSLKLQPEKIRYTIAVEEYTEKAFDLDVEIVNVPGKKSVTVYPKKIRVVFRVGLSNYEMVDETSFRAVADFTGMDFGKSKYVLVKIEEFPPYIKNMDYSPKSLEYIIYN